MNDQGVTSLVRTAAEVCGFDVVVPTSVFPTGKTSACSVSVSRVAWCTSAPASTTTRSTTRIYDFPDELIATGVDLLDQVVRSATGP